MLLTIIIFLVVLGLLVFVHEAGHFLVAKKSGMKVDEFGFGFPPRLLGIQKSEGKWRVLWRRKKPTDTENTIYSINWIPFGGFVKIVGENNDNDNDPRSFTNKPFFARLLTLVAGVLMNVVLAWILISLGYMRGLPVAVDDPSNLSSGGNLRNQQVAIVEVLPDSPAAAAGLQPSDIILTIDGKPFSNITEVQRHVLERKGNLLEFRVKRVNEEKTLSVKSLGQPPPGQGATGIGLAVFGELQFPFHRAIVEGARSTWYQLSAIASGLYNLVVSGAGFSQLGGPIKIAQLTGQVADLGLTYLMQFTAFLSLNLALLNILPFPALDGGRVMFLIVEKIRGKRNNQKVEQIANTAGFLLLLLLMLVITVHDVTGLKG